MDAVPCAAPKWRFGSSSEVRVAARGASRRPDSNRGPLHYEPCASVRKRADLALARAVSVRCGVAAVRTCDGLWLPRCCHAATAQPTARNLGCRKARKIAGNASVIRTLGVARSMTVTFASARAEVPVTSFVTSMTATT
jgi:hypothetical protein